MKKFYKKVDLRSRKKIVNFLENHFRYDTVNYSPLSQKQGLKWELVQTDRLS